MYTLIDVLRAVRETQEQVEVFEQELHAIKVKLHNLRLTVDQLVQKNTPHEH